MIFNEGVHVEVEGNCNVTISLSGSLILESGASLKVLNCTYTTFLKDVTTIFYFMAYEYISHHNID